jgi:Concanavalin A-like lectin/glucanases superfamily/Domain of unknown function (DUF2341)/Carbohydrate esterase, sialic acid-specific acetylesterase
MMKKLMALVCGLLPGLTVSAVGQYPDWSHQGLVYILTTRDGANLPSTAKVENFPLLVRLGREFFDFSQTKANGADLRFSMDGKPLPYEIEDWDPDHGVASAWVRIPLIRGDEARSIQIHWGKADAESESNGRAVFSESNGYVSVMHLGSAGDAIVDSTDAIHAMNAGTTVSPGVIGKGRRFEPGQGIKGGESITNLPTGSSDNTSEAWFRAESPNALAMAWGNEEWQGKITMRIASPPHVQMECYFSSADVHGKSPLPMGEWVQVVHTYHNGESLVYVNGQLDGATHRTNAPLKIRTPARMYIGGWYDDYRFTGSVDEVRISRVVRSPEWVRLQYENQKPLQTLVGPIVSVGNRFTVSKDSIEIQEGQHETVTGVAEGALKLYWIVKRDGHETVAAVDQKSVTIEAGRVTGDTSHSMEFKAVYPNEVRRREIQVRIREAIPEPIFTLKSPTHWNGRDRIEVFPVLSNRDAMNSRGAGKLKYTWHVTNGAVIQEIAPDRLILERSQFSGTLRVKATINNGGADVVAETSIEVTEPKEDPWVPRIPEPDEKAVDNQFFARDEKNEGTVHYTGKLSTPAEQVFLKLYAEGNLVDSKVQVPKTGTGYSFETKLKPGLVHYSLEFGTKANGVETALATVTNLVCGDAYLIEGQSNALSTDTGEDSPAVTSDWIRSYGSPTGDETTDRQNLWCNPVWKAQKGEKAELGYWGMELAKRLVESQRIPIFILNGAVGGTRIDQHQRNSANPTDLNTIYGRMLWRLQHARLTHGIRAVLWHQGESDQGSDGPTGGYGWETYDRYFVAMTGGWKRDFPNIQHYYCFQIWPNSCSMGNGHGDMLREVQRNLPRLFSHLDVMSTLGIRPEGPCHYPLKGWAEFARLIQPLIERDNYGGKFTNSITAPNLRKAWWIGSGSDKIALEFDQPVVWKESLANQFYLDDKAGLIASGAVDGSMLVLQLKEPTAAQRITYLKEMNWSPDQLILGKNGIAALTFCDIPVSIR